MIGVVGWRSVPTLVQQRCSAWTHRSVREWASEIAPRLVGQAVAEPGDWRTTASAYTSTSLVVVTVASAMSARRFVVKVPCAAHGTVRLRRQAEVLATLHRDTNLRSLHPLMPRCVEQGEVDGRYYCIEDALPGHSAGATILRQADRATLLASAIRVVGDLHVRTGRETLLDRAVIADWVDTPALRLQSLLAGQRRYRLLLDAVDRLRGELDAALAGRTVRTCWIHGDFWPGNLLADKAGTEVTGVVDWDGAAARELRLHDLLHLHIFFRRLIYGDELGEVVVRALRRGIDDAIGTSTAQVTSWLDGIPQRAAVLLYWLRHVVLFIDTKGHHDNPRWLRANVQHVLVNI